MKAIYPGDPYKDPLFWLCVPIILMYFVARLFAIGGQIAWTWIKTKLPSRKAYYSCCRDCGWRLSWDTASLICPPCQRVRRNQSGA